VQCLIECGADVNAKDNSELFPLCQAIKGGRTEIAKCLIEYGASVNENFITDERGYNATLLHATIEHYHYQNDDIAKMLIQYGADVNAKSRFGTTPIYHVNKVEIAKLLIEYGADVNAKDSWGNTPLASMSNGEVAKMLIDYGADTGVINKDGKTLLHCVAQHGTVEIIEFFISNGLDVNAKDNEGQTPLFLAVEENSDVEVIKFLISKGADANAKNDNDFSILHMVACPDARNGDAITVSAEVAEILISNGGDVNAKDCIGRIPLHIAVNSRVDGLLKCLSKGADVNARDNSGNTPLHAAAEEGDIEDVQFLVSKGADVNVVNMCGKTPHDVAREMAVKMKKEIKKLGDKAIGTWIESRNNRCMAVSEYLESIGAKSGKNDKKNGVRLTVICIGTPDLDDYNYVCTSLDILLSKSSNLSIAVPELYKQGAELLFKRYSMERSHHLDVFELPVDDIAEFQRELHKTIDGYRNPAEGSHSSNENNVALIVFGDTEIVRATCQIANERGIKFRKK
jgi:ankyrin repeat protein